MLSLIEKDKKTSRDMQDYTADALLFIKEDTVVLYHYDTKIARYKTRLYKEFGLLVDARPCHCESDRFYYTYRHRLEAVKLEELSKYRYYRYVHKEKKYFHETYMDMDNRIRDVLLDRGYNTIKDIVNDPKLLIYSRAFKPLIGMHYKTYMNFMLDDHEDNFMWDKNNKRIIPIDLFIN